ncbi:MAG: peptidylprolyl isomerase [Ignavibacteriae bacterium]|nr:peptidylprolyl isomerase [Ignavibacteriota bacterium]
MKKHIKVGDKIKLHYEGSFEDGSIFDSSIEREPLTVTAGNGEVIKGFDDALIGMEVKQKKKVNINSDNAYGPIQKELIVEIARNKLPEDMNLNIGQQLQIPIEDGNNIVVTIKEISDEKILLDGNHPLAGRNLIFNIEIIEIE